MHFAASILRRPRPDLGALAVTDDELAALAPGDFLLSPGETAAQWLTAPPADGAAHVLAAAAPTATGAASADAAQPPPPPLAEGLLLVRGGRPYAVLAPDRVGEAAAYRVMERK